MTTPELTISPHEPRPRILCVDDEPLVLEALGRNLRNKFDLVMAPGSAAALVELDRDPSFAVIMSDLRMPGMDGVALLARANELAPDAVRVLLTGHADLEVAIAAVNRGRVYQFLRKPCHPQVMARALELANEQHLLVTAERELLAQTLRGTIRTLADVLALASPTAFGRSERVQRMAARMARQLALTDTWPIEVAATIWHLGCLAVSPSLASRIGNGAELEPEELALVEQLPATALRLIANIPRLDAVRELLGSVGMSPTASVPVAAQILRAALETDTLEARGIPGAAIRARLEVELAGYDHRVMKILSENLGGNAADEAAAATRVSQMRLIDVTLGMVFAGDVVTEAGLLLVARGQEVTPPLLERVRTYWHGFAQTAMVKMILPSPRQPEQSDAGSDGNSSRPAGRSPMQDAPAAGSTASGNADRPETLTKAPSLLAEILAGG